MRVFIICVGEPIPTLDSDVRMRRVGMIASELANRGHDVNWITSTFDHYKKKDLFSETTVYEYNGFKVHALHTIQYKKNVSLKRVKFHKKIAKAILNYCDSLEVPDIVLGSMEPIEVSTVVKEYAVKNNIKYVLDVRDLWPEIFYDVFPKIFKPILFPYVHHCKKKLKKVFANCDSIIAPSEGFLEYGLKYAQHSKTENDQVFNMGYMPTNVSKITDSKFNIIFIGTIGKQFDLDTVLSAASLLTDYEDIIFYIAGDGEDLPRLKMEYNLPNVKYLGWIEKQDIENLLSIASIGLAPYINSINYQRNMPNKIGEYLSIGLPILTNCEGIIEETLEKYHCGHRYENANDLKEKIMGLHQNQQQFIEYSKNAKLCFDEKMNAQIIYEKLADFLEEKVEN